MATRKPTTKKHALIQRIALSGLSYHGYALVAKQLVPGDELYLVPEPANVHDGYAVSVHTRDVDDSLLQIGWIPKGQNEMLHRLLVAGVEIRCKIISHDPSRPLDSRVYVANYITIEA